MAAPPPNRRQSGRPAIRILTYNVHSCRGTDGRTDPVRIAEVIARCEADIVALQELDVGRKRSGSVDQAQAIAAHLEMKAHFHPVLNVAEEKYGDAILTAFPTRLVKAAPLPSMGEQRGAIWASIDVQGTELTVVNTHLGLRRRERIRQVETLLGPAWLGHPDAREPKVLLGDFNALPTSAVYRDLVRTMTDVQTISRRRAPTFPSRFPMLRLDYIFVSGLIPTDTEVRGDFMARTASDHLPLVATVSLQ